MNPRGSFRTSVLAINAACHNDAQFVKQSIRKYILNHTVFSRKCTRLLSYTIHTDVLNALS